MNFQIINRKVKRKIIFFLVIISFLISLVFPQATNAQNSEEDIYQKFSIQVDTSSCPEDLIVKLVDKPLFCVQDTEQKLPDEKDIKYWEQEKEILKFEAERFTKNINNFANTKIDIKELIFAPDCENENEDKNKCISPSQKRENYYYLQIVYQDKSKYFDKNFNKGIIKIGKKTNLNIDEEWDENKDEWIFQREQIRKNINNAIVNYRKSFKLVLPDSNKSQTEETVPEDKRDKEDKGDNGDKLNLSKQAVQISGKTGKEPIFYIRTWNNGLSPSERAKRVSEKIEKIIQGKIDIQGVGVFEQSTENIENEGSTNEQPKIIKIISDSKFLSEADKKIMQVTYQDALLAGKDNAADLAQEYLIEIDKLVAEHKSGTKNIEKRGYPVTFFKDRLFSINSGLGTTKSGSNLYQASHRASEIADRIKKFAQKKLFLPPNRLVAVYSKGKKLCILPESLKAEDYAKFKANSNFDQKNNSDCKVEDLVRRSDLKIIYGDEITKKINRGDWKLTNTPTKNSASLKRAGLPETIIFMELNDDNYEHLMDILVTELDSVLHTDTKNIETREDLAIYFLKQIEKKVAEYRSTRKIWFIISIILLITILQLFFKINYLMKEAFSKIRFFLFEDIKNTIQNSPYLSDKIDILHPANKTFKSIFLKLFLLTLTVIFALFNLPEYYFAWFNISGILSRFSEDLKNIIFSYVYTELPLLLLIVFVACILYQAINIFDSKKIDEIQDSEKKAKFKSLLVILRILLVIFTFIFITPHLPAAGTIYFKAISGFAVLAFTWSASSAISDFVSGIILIYFTSLKIGDWIEVGDTIGEIMNQNLIFHKLKTSKEWVKTIPNSFLLNNCTANLSLSCQKGAKIIIHVPVGLGYDVPRDLVETTLIGAALKTDRVVKNISDYAPFVLITNLGDFAVTYELNVYTENPAQITTIYSDLQKNIQDQCDLRGIEILSPNYSTLRFDIEDSATT